jgi:hypothetical protein
MKRLTLISISIFLLTNIIYGQDIINETGKDGKFIVRDAEQKEQLRVEDGSVEITGELKIETMPEGKNTDDMVVWDRNDKSLKVVPRIFSKVSPLSEPLNTRSWHSIGYDQVDDEGNEISASVQGSAVTWNQFNTDYGYIKLGPANIKGAHIYTDMSKFIFNKKVFVTSGEFGAHASADLIFKTGGKTRLIMKNNTGDVGIGTTNPLSKLSVGGDGASFTTIYGQNANSLGKGVFGFASNSGDVENYGGYFQSVGEQGRGVYGYASNSGDVENYGGYFRAEGSTGRGVYGYATNSGIGTNYGGYFEGRGSTGRGVFGYASNSGNVLNYGGYFYASGSSGIGVHGISYGTNGKGVVGWGNVAVTSYDFDAIGPGVNYGATSSIRWKNNIVEIDAPLEKLAKLRGVYFDWDEEHGGGHDVGMIAEEVGKVLPEIVVYEENGIDADGMDYSKLTPLLVEAVNAQQEIIAELQKRIELLESN